ncbi:MAG: rhodanese-like domain-containing protein [Nitrososphaerales archaeon]
MGSLHRKVAVCNTGARSLPVAFALRAIGFNNVYALDGGIVKLAENVGRKACEYVR